VLRRNDVLSAETTTVLSVASAATFCSEPCPVSSENVAAMAPRNSTVESKTEKRVFTVVALLLNEIFQKAGSFRNLHQPIRWQSRR
jgi:N-dimethylarginine dimethylaminohydrolase